MAKELLDYIRDETNRRIDELRGDVREMSTKMDANLLDLQKFKITMIVSSRWISLIVSAVCGLITLLISVAVTVWATNRTAPVQPSKGGHENVGFSDSVGTRISVESRDR